MSETPDDLRIRFDEGRGAYLAERGDRVVGLLEAREESEGVTVMPHTEVDDAEEGKGVGSALARRALDDVREAGKRVRPSCPFVRGWIDHHPDYEDLVV